MLRFNRFETTQAKLNEAQTEITKRQAQRQMMKNFIDNLHSQPEQVEIFYEGAWYVLCDCITVYSKDKIRVRFNDGIEIYV